MQVYAASLSSDSLSLSFYLFIKKPLQLTLVGLELYNCE